jgi:hypothetical protein
MQMQKEWLSKVRGWAKAAYMDENRAIQLSVLLWANRAIGPIENFDSSRYNDFAMILSEGSPWKGRWVKSEEKRKTKGAVRPDDDPTEYSWEQFIADYGYRKSLKESKLAFSKLGEADRLCIRDTVAIYVAETPDPKYRLHARTYINQRKWEDYASSEKRDFSIPDSGEFRSDFIAYRAKTKDEYPTLPENSMLNYKEYSNLRSKAWEKDFKVNVGTSVLKGIVDKAHQESLVKGGLVYDKFILLLKNHT